MKTFKDAKEAKELHSSWKSNREGKPSPRGGHTNLLKQAELELEELEAQETLEVLKDLVALFQESKEDADR